MKFGIGLIQFSFCFIFSDGLTPRKQDGYLDAEQIVAGYGYGSESHTIVTDDGYILKMHRVLPKGFNRKRSPVLMHHGILGASTDFLLAGKKSLAFLLSDLGFDVWLGNLRGNDYSRAHRELFPDDVRFWNFSWHDSAVHDLPTEIDYICNVTHKPKVVYVGFSMGTTVLLALTSTLPHYNDKIETAFLMAPVAYLSNIRSVITRELLDLLRKYYVIIHKITDGQLLTQREKFRWLLQKFCAAYNVEEKLCWKLVFLVCGSDPENIDPNLLPILLHHYPAGYSLKAAHHYAQVFHSGEFRQYDYGPSGNQEMYNSTSPPDYRLDAITIPLHMYLGQNDLMSTMKDVQNMVAKLTTQHTMWVVKNPKFSHLDFVFAANVWEDFYKKLLEDVMNWVAPK